MFDTQAHWHYSNPVQIRFGPGCLSALPELVGGRRTLLVTTPGFARRGLVGRLGAMLGGAALTTLDNVQPNPDLYDIQAAAQQLVGQGVEVVVALGGGSAIDTAKALSFVLGAGSPELLQQCLVQGAVPPGGPPLPLIAIPTTAGTGSEVTPFATIWDKARQKKYSLTQANLHPWVALLDPALTLSLPLETTISAGLDALSQALEAIWNRHASPLTTIYATQAARIALDALPQLAQAPGDLSLRSQMMGASLLAGLAISQTRTALAHSMSYPITARYGLPHGLACSFTLPAILEFNAAADDGRLAQAAQALGSSSVARLHDRLERLLQTLGVDQLLRCYVPAPEELAILAPQMLTPGRADNNMRPADIEQVGEILAAAMERLGRPETESMQTFATWAE